MINNEYVRKLISGIRKQIDIGMAEFREDSGYHEAISHEWIDAELLCIHLEKHLNEEINETNR